MNILRLKELMKEKGINNIELSNEVGLSITSMSRIINNSQSTGFDNLLKIATALDVDIRELFKSSKGSEMINGFVEYKGVIHRILSRKDLDTLIDLIDE